MISTETLSAIRFGYGPGGRDVPPDAATHIARLKRGDRMVGRYPTPDLEAAIALGEDHRKARKAAQDGGSDRGRRQAQVKLGEMFGSALMAGFARIAETDDPLRERLTWFWADHFTAVPTNAVTRAVVPDYIDSAIRPHVTGRFSDMLVAVVTHPLMLIYLDQIASVGPNSPVGQRRGRGLNENLAREVLELHTLGVEGPYSQRDVTQLAELFTGLSGQQGKGFVFRQGIVEPGAETVLGRQYGGGRPSLAPIRAVLADLAVHPATAAHVSRKLAVHFVADEPDPALVAAMEAAWLETGGDLMAVTQAMLEHPAVWEAPLTKVRQPHDFFGATLTALGISGDELMAVPVRDARRNFIRPLRDMGQPFMTAPGPDGWPETAEHWVTPLGLANRIVWAFEAARHVADRAGDTGAFVTRALGDAASDRLRWAAGVAETREEALALVLASPEFNRR
ncbi:MAG: DUF1800 domain-containing protein [Pseudomonadota bacterium]